MSQEQYAVVVPIPATLFDEHGAVAEIHLKVAREVASEHLKAAAERLGFTVTGTTTAEVVQPGDAESMWRGQGMSPLDAGAYRTLTWVST